ncbi:MAG: efflux RND transporter periplasmic adaptor subunit [Ktedonobacteraceae bacterium]
MSETHDISETDTHTMPTMPPKSFDLPMDFGPLIDGDTEDFEFTQLPVRPTRKRGLIWLSIILLLILLGGGGIFTYRNLHSVPAVTYTQAAATIGNLTVAASGTGPVQPAAVYNLNFPTSAPIASIAVQVGQQVHQGDVLATLNATALQDAITQAQNNVNSAQTSVNSAANSLSSTKSQQATALSIASLNQQNAITICDDTSKTPAANEANCEQLANEQYKQAQNQANAATSSAQNQVNSAVQQRTSAQQALQTAQNNMQNATLTAPHDGVIESVNGQVGENPGGGGTGANATSFIVLVDASTLNVAAQINEANIATVAVNQPATFTVAAYPSQTFRASVTSINTQGQTASNVVSYLVNLAVDMKSINNAHVYPGMTATISITTDQRIGSLLVPSAALAFSTTAIQNGELSRSALRSLVSNGPSSGTRGIVVELKAGKLVPVLVTTGLSDGQFTEILSGLNENDQVIVGQTGGTTTTGGAGGAGGGGRGGAGGGGRGGAGGFGGGATGN